MSLERWSADELRFPTYSEAIAQAVRPGDCVVDIGSGPGVFALLACKAGARKVYAIDTKAWLNSDGCLRPRTAMSERIEVLRGDSRQILLPSGVKRDRFGHTRCVATVGAGDTRTE